VAGGEGGPGLVPQVLAVDDHAVHVEHDAAQRHRSTSGSSADRAGRSALITSSTVTPEAWSATQPAVSGRQSRPSSGVGPRQRGAHRFSDVVRVRRWCAERCRSGRAIRSGVECDVGARDLTIVECRPPWRPEFGPDWTRFPIARLRYTKTRREWSLYWRDRNLGFHAFAGVGLSTGVDDLLAEIDRDATGIFWG
jgi:Protein of unknown function (DUF3024)